MSASSKLERILRSMSDACRIYGVRIRSNVSLPGLRRSADTGQPELAIWLKSTPAWLRTLVEPDNSIKLTSSEPDENGNPSFIIWELDRGAYFRLRYSNGAEFIVDRPGDRIWVDWPDSVALEDIATCLLGPVMGWVLRLRGRTCLHASGVAIGDQIAAFIGPSGAGKSTTAAIFAQSGYPVSSDDIVTLSEHRGCVYAHPGSPGLRLCADAVRGVHGSEHVPPHVAPSWDKHRLDLSRPEYRFQQRPLPVAAIYELNGRSSSPPHLEAVSGTTALMTLIADTHANRLLDRSARAKEFEILGNLLRQVRYRRVTPRHDLERLPELRDLIVADFLAREVVS